MWLLLGPSSLFLLLCLSATEALGGGRWEQRRGTEGEWAGVACWGPGVWPHPAHCSLFSVCRMTGSGVRGVLLRCPGETAFVTRRWRCYPDQYTRCAQRPISQELLRTSMEMRIPKVDMSPRQGLCPFPKPYCSSETTLTVCAPNHLLIGNVTCPSSCMEDEFGAFCDPEDGHGTTQETKPITTTALYSEVLPILDANLMESAIKITSSLGLGPAHKDSVNQTSPKPSGVKRPGVPAHTAPVFDLSGSPEEYSNESEQVDEDKPVFSKPTVLVHGSQGLTTANPLPGGNEDSQVFTIENIQSSTGAAIAQMGVGATDGGLPSNMTTAEKPVNQDEEERAEEKLEREKMEREKLEREKLEREKLEREKLEREKLEREKLEREKLEREKLEREKLEREKLEREKLEREKLEREKMEREKLEREKLEREKQEREKMEREKMEREKLEREKLEREKLEREKLEREKMEREKMEREKLEREKMEREKLEREKLEKEMEREKQEREKLKKEKEREKMEIEKLEREKLEEFERKKIENEKLEREKLMHEKLEKERLEMERIENKKKEQEEKRKAQEKLEAEKNGNNSSEPVVEEVHGTSPFLPHDLARACTRPGLKCINSNILLECSSDLVPLRAWNCGSFFSRSATLIAKCDHERDSCVAAVDDGSASNEEDYAELPESQPLCKRPGAQCADNATLIHCSDDLRSATVAVCADLFPEVDGGAVCDQMLDACVVRIGEDGEEYSYVQIIPDSPMSTTTDVSTQPGELPSSTEVMTPISSSVGSTVNHIHFQPGSTPTAFPVTEKFPGKPYPSDDPSDTLHALFPMLGDQCRKPGLRCYGGRVLEACEKDNPNPVYRMDCTAVLADSLDARCEEQSEGEATCMVALRRNAPLLKEGQMVGTPMKENEIFTLELSVVDVTRTFEYDDSEIPPWRCSRVGQYCADDSTLLSCNADFTLEFALSCGAIAPESVVAFCDHSRDACVVKKISDLTSSLSENNTLLDMANDKNKTYSGNQTNNFESPGQEPEKVKPSFTMPGFSDSPPLSSAMAQTGSMNGPTKWEFSTISQLYPPDVPLSAYSVQPSKEQMTLKGSIQYSADTLLQNKCTKAGPVCLDEFHLGSCSEELELRYILPCSALYNADPVPFCDSKLSACLPSASRQTTTTADITATTETPISTTTVTSTKAPTTLPSATTSQPSTFIPQKIPPYNLYGYPTPAGAMFGSPPRNPTIHENQFASLHSGHINIPLVDSNFPLYPYIRPETYSFIQRPGMNSQYSTQQSRLPDFLQNILQNYGIRWPSFSETPSQPTMSSFPFLNNILQSISTLRPPGILQQNTEYGLYGGQEPYDYNNQYQQYAGTYSNAYPPITYHSILPGSQLIKDDRPVTPLTGVPSPYVHSDILKYYTNLLTAAKQPEKQLPSSISSNLFKNKPQNPAQSYLNRFLEVLQQHDKGQVSPGSHILDFFKSKFPVSSDGGSPTAHTEGSSSIASQLTTDKVNTPGVAHSSGFQGGISHVNPLTWLDKVEVPDTTKTSLCKRPGMQCVNSDSLGACSKNLELRYVIPCRNLLPFVSIGKPFCDRKNDACGVLVDKEPSEYPTDFTSYP